MPPQRKDLPRSDDLDATWHFLKKGMEHIFTKLEEGLTYTKYMDLYTVIYNFCTHNKMTGEAPQHSSGGIMDRQQRGAYLMGQDLYKYLIIYLNEYLKTLRKEAQQYQDEELLKYYSKQWNRFTQAAEYLNRIFKYLNRHWVKRETDEGRKHVHEVYTLSLVRWQIELFTPIHEPLLAALLKMIEKGRNGEVIETTLLREVIASFVSMGQGESAPDKANLEIYRTKFQDPFIAATALYYQHESTNFLSTQNVVDYLIRAETRLNEESSRVDLFLHSSTKKPLLQRCEEVLIKAHKEVLEAEFQGLIDGDRQTDLKRLYSLLSKITPGLDVVKTKFEAHVRKAGLASVEKIAPTDGSSPEGKVYVDALLDVHKTYHALVTNAFRGDAEFVKCLDNACKEFVNRNKVCRTGSSRSPELLARYADSLLKKGPKALDDDELERTLTDIMTVFKYVEDKDVFQKFYSRMLSRRLVNSTQASDEAETSMITKLKEACGFEYTNKLSRMFQDMGVSKDLEKAFLESLTERDSLGLDFSILVLSTASWPLTPPTTTFDLPAELIKPYDRFHSFYTTKHSGRKLTWLTNLSRGEMRANYSKHSRVPYTFTVSTYQMGILLSYNNADVHTYEELQGITNLNKEALDGALGVLVKSGVLLIEPKGESPGASAGQKLSLNLDYKSKKLRVNLNQGIKTEQKQESDETHKTVEEDRRMLIQSAIVRIMKARKKLKHVDLITEILSQISTRFTPKISDIKKSIDIMIEKDYIERMPDEKDTYSYLA